MSYMTVQQAAEKIQYSRSSLYKFCKSGLIPSSKINGKRLIKEDDIEKLLGKVKTQTPPDDHILQEILLTTVTQTTIENLKGGKGAMARAKKKRLNCGFGQVYIKPTKSGKPRFYLDYRDSSGKRRQELDRTATCFEDAIITLRNRVQKEHDKLNGIVRRRTDIGFSEFAKSFLQDYLMTEREKSWRDESYRLNVCVGFFKNTPLRNVTSQQIRRFKSERLSAGNSKISVNRYRALLHKMFNVAIEDGYIQENPVSKVKRYSELENVRNRVLTEDEEQRLMTESSNRLKLILKVALNTGMRLSEIRRLNWKNLDLEKKEIRVVEAKSGKSRKIPINSTLYGELIKLKSQDGRDDQVFPFKSIRTAFANACERACIKDFTFHDLRRTFGTRLLERGVDIVTISRLYGHSSVLVTQRYLHPKDELSRAAVELLADTSNQRDGIDADLLQIRYSKKREKALVN